MVKPNKWLDSRLGLCFCDHCVERAAAAGIDARQLETTVREDIESYLAGDVDFPDDMAEAFWLSDVATDGALSSFLNWRCDVVTSLVARDSRGGAGGRDCGDHPVGGAADRGAWYEGSNLRALAQATGIVEACFYEPSVERVRAEIRDVQRRLAGAGKLRGILRPGFPDLQSRAELVAAAQGALRRRNFRDRFLQLRSLAPQQSCLDRRRARRVRRLIVEFQQQSRRHHWRGRRYRSGAVQAFRRTGRRDRRTRPQRGRHGLRRRAPERGDHNRGGRRRYRRCRTPWPSAFARLAEVLGPSTS